MDLEPKMLPTVRALLDVNRGRWREIAEQTGVPYGTIQNIAQGRTSDPGVNAVEKLYRWLTNGVAA